MAPTHSSVFGNVLIKVKMFKELWCREILLEQVVDENRQRGKKDVVKRQKERIINRLKSSKIMALIFPSYEKMAKKYFYLSRVGTMNSEENH